MPPMDLIAVSEKLNVILEWLTAFIVVYPIFNKEVYNIY